MQATFDIVHNSIVLAIGPIRSCLLLTVNRVSSWCPEERSSDQMVTVLIPLMVDATTEYIADVVSIRQCSYKCLNNVKMLGI